MSEEKDTNKEDKRKFKQRYKPKLPYVFENNSLQYENSPETERRVFEVADMVVKGKTKQTCITHLREKYNITDRIANAYYNASIEYLMPKDVDKHRNQLIEKNLIRLEKIIEKTMDKENYKDAINAIKEINRCINPNGNTVEVATKDTAFRIKFNND